MKISYLLDYQVKNYAWGKLGEESLVYRLKKQACEESHIQLDTNLPYAEMWLGSHPSGQSMVKKENEVGEIPLSQLMSQNNMPPLEHLTKVLSVGDCLSIQLHPDKKIARELHLADPSHYPDSNHKPEMAIALTPFQAFCGFRPIKEIIRFFMENTAYDNLFTPQLKICMVQLFNTNAEYDVDAPAPHRTWTVMCSQILKEIVKSIIMAPKDNISLSLSAHYKNLIDSKAKTDSKSMEKNSSYENESIIRNRIFCKMYHSYPHDFGCIFLYLLNYFELSPGDAVSIPAKVPHAYYSGDCVECMACSDNVIRLGLTPKFIDIPHAIETLSYDGIPKECFQPIRDILESGAHCSAISYRSCVEEFTVTRLMVNCEVQTEEVLCKRVPESTILVIIEGSASLKLIGSLPNGATSCEIIDVYPGQSYYILWSCQIQVEKLRSSSPLHAYISHRNIHSVN